MTCLWQSWVSVVIRSWLVAEMPSCQTILHWLLLELWSKTEKKYFWTDTNTDVWLKLGYSNMSQNAGNCISESFEILYFSGGYASRPLWMACCKHSSIMPTWPVKWNWIIKIQSVHPPKNFVLLACHSLDYFNQSSLNKKRLRSDLQDIEHNKIYLLSIPWLSYLWWHVCNM